MLLSHSLTHLGFLQTILFLDQPEKIESLIGSGILTYPGQMEFFTGKKDDAIKHIQRDPPDLLISGLAFSEGNALDLIRELKETVGVIPSIFIGDESERELKNEVLKLGVFDVLERPFEVTELIKKIDRAVRLSGQYRQKSRLESFVEYAKLQEESVHRGMMVSEWIELKNRPTEE